MNHRWRAYSRPATASQCSPALLTLFVREDPRRAHLVLFLAVVVLYGVVPQVVGLRGAARHRVDPAAEAHGGIAVVVRAVVARALGDLCATSTSAPGYTVGERGTMNICLCTRGGSGGGSGEGGRATRDDHHSSDRRRREVLHVALVELAARHAHERPDQRQDPAEPLDAVRAPRRRS